MHLIILYPPSPMQTVYVRGWVYLFFMLSVRKSVCPFTTISSWLGYIVSNKHCLLTIFASTVGIWSRCFVYPTGTQHADILCMVGRCACGLDIMLIFFLHLLTRVNLVHFASIIYIELVSCVCNSSYRFRPICLKLC